STTRCSPTRGPTPSSSSTCTTPRWSTWRRQLPLPLPPGQRPVVALQPLLRHAVAVRPGAERLGAAAGAVRLALPGRCALGARSPGRDPRPGVVAGVAAD